MQDHSKLSNGTVLAVLGIIFAGLHIPLGAIGIGRFALGYSDPMALIICAFIGTLVAAALTLGLVLQRLAPRIPATRAG